MKIYNYQVKEDGKEWEVIRPIPVRVESHREAVAGAKNLAKSTGKEVRLSEKGSIQGYYFRPNTMETIKTD